ncbi:MAG: Wzz/FepE/Etk N-terminal domain-containing protein [Candidatus Cloacimonadaceae bacterium]
MMNKDMGILDIVYILAKHRKLVIGLTLLVAIAAVIYAMLAPFYWKSTATIVPVSESNAIGGFSTNILDMMGGGLIKTQKSELAIDFIAIMKSRSFRERVIEEFGLIDYFKIKKPYEHARELALYKLQNSLMRLSFDQESYLVSITAETKDKELSRRIVQYYLDELDTYNRDSRLSKGKLKREFLQAQVEQNMREADSLAQVIKDFQVKNKSIALDQQTSALVDMYSENVAKYFSAEIEYELALQQYSESSPVVQNLAEKKKLLQDKMKELEDSQSSLQPKYILQIDKIPELSMQYAQLMINAEIKKKIIEYLYPQFELAKLEELKDMPSFEVIDAPREAGMRSKPKRAILVIVLSLAGFIFSSFLVFIAESLNQNKELVQRIIAALKGRVEA